MAKIVVFTSGTLGDHLPYLALACGLQEQGHEILMVINQAMHPYAERAGLQAVAVTDVERGPEEAREHAWAWDHWNHPLTKAQQHPQAKPQPPETFITQVKELAGYLEGADLLLATAIRPHGLAASLVKEIPWMTLSVNPSAFELPADNQARDRTFYFERMQYESIRYLIDEALTSLGQRRLIPAWHHGCQWAEHIILGSSPHFSQPNPQQLQPFSSLDQTGFWHWDDPTWETWQPGSHLLSFCERRPLVLSFSSQPLEDPQRFLRLHVEAAQKLQLPLLVQRGWADFSEADLPPGCDQDQIYFLDYAPHDWLFARARCAIQHGGIGSLARALRQYCPVVIEPFGNDQFYNAQRVVNLGVGTAVHPFQTTSDQLAAIIDKQILAKQTRLRAKILGRKLRLEDGISAAVSLVNRYLERQRNNVSARSPTWWGVHPLENAVPEKKTAVEPGQVIPQIIHHTWKNKDIPEAMQGWYESWQRFHPGWQFRLWTDEDCRQLIVDEYPWFLPIYDAYPQHIMRVDAVRYFIMHRFGGVYVDLDYEALRSLEPLLEGHQLALTTEPPAHMHNYIVHGNRLNHLVSNAFLASVPGHPFWEFVFDLLASWQSAGGPLDATGPFLLSRAYNGYANQNQLFLLPYQLLSPLSSAEPWSNLPQQIRWLVKKDAFAIHHWHGSWFADPPRTEGPSPVQILMRGRLQPGELLVDEEQLLAFSAEQHEKPLISCLMITRERPLLAQLSVHCFKNQSYPNRELIIVDDGPDDRLHDWVKRLQEPRIRFFRLPDEGKNLGELRNYALAQAQGSYLAQWDDDDFSAPLRLELQMAAIQMYRVDTCLLNREMIWLPTLPSLAKSAYRLWEGSALVPTSAVSQYPQTRQGEDTAVIEKVILNTNTILLDMPHLYLYIFHGHNTFDEDHWQQQLMSATVRYEHYKYLPALREYEKYLSVKLENLGAFLTGQVIPDERVKAPLDEKQPALAEPPAPVGQKTPQEKIIILTPVKNAAHVIPTYLKNLKALTYPHDLISIAFLESDSSDGTYQRLQEALPDLQREFGRAQLFRKDFGFEHSGNRWQPQIQYRRRATIARSRNALLQQALQDEDWVLWVDADLLSYPPDIIETLLAADKRIVVPNCLQRDGSQPFDLNSFKLKPEARKIDWKPYIIDDLLQPPQGLGRHYLSDLSDQELVELDAVGSTMLLVQANLHRDGLIFPPFSYKHFIESEGLAMMASDMGARCWGLPKVIIRHS